MKSSPIRFLFGVACIASACAGGVTFHLDPAAKSEGDGSAANPFRTFERAQAAVRKAVADPKTTAGEIKVLVAPGRHRVAKRIQFLPRDSGTSRNPVKWMAAERGMTRLTGGIDLPKLKRVSDSATLARIPEAARAHVLEADLKAAGISESNVTAELVWDDAPLVAARWPNEGYTFIKDAKSAGRGKDGRPLNGTEFVYADEHVAKWADEKGAFATGFFRHNWAAATIEIASIDVASNVVHQGRVVGGNNYGYGKGGYWFGHNLLCELDREGEWQFDRAAGKIRVWPPKGKPKSAPQLTSTDTLLAFHSVTNLAVVGFVLENARGVALNAGGECCALDVIGCRFLNVGTAASFSRLVSGRIAGCDVSHCARGGFFVTGGDPKTLRHAETIIENCAFDDFSRSNPTYTPAVRISGCGIAVRRCLMRRGPHAAILFGGREHSIAYNEIHSVCLESGEMGAIYTGRDWTLCGNEIVGNYVHDIGSKRTQTNRAVMLDDGAAGIVVASNRFVRVSEGVSLSSVGNVVSHNLFVANFPSFSGWQTWLKPEQFKPSHYTHQSLLDRFAEVPVESEPWKSRYPYLAQIGAAMRGGTRRVPASNTRVEGNVIVGGPEAFFYTSRNEAYPAAWTFGKNVRSKDGREAEAFLPPMDSIGVYESSERATWPVANPFRKIPAKELRMVHADTYHPIYDAYGTRCPIAAERIGVCSWSWKLPMREAIAATERAGVKQVNLALMPFVENDKWHGGSESKETWDWIKAKVAAGEITIASTMISTVGEDYTTIDSIRRTGGIVPDQHWEANKLRYSRGAQLTKELGCEWLLTHAGFLDEKNPAALAKYVERVTWMRDELAKSGVKLILETGQETAENLAAFLPKVPGVYVNFDPANMIQYGMGRPMEAVRALAPWVRQVHVKDARFSNRRGVWGDEMPWSEGEAGGAEFVALLESLGFRGAYVVECEDGADRAALIRTAIERLQAK